MGLRSYVKQLNYSYEVTTGLYMLEPWEKAVFNSVVMVGFLLTTYATYNYVSKYTGVV
ncbi:MAG: small subunit of serine palmitoyltransferase-like protein [Benniella sp.]|nr:MAG: small subunit of serine palmitoyltransferase-like protein [Benniella sp.]